MFSINDGVMYLTKGDSRPLTFSLTDSSGNAYTMQSGDRLILTVKESASDGAATLFSIESESTLINILHSHTDQIPVGQYSASVRLETAAGDVYTIFPDTLDTAKMKTEKNWHNFWIMPRCQ